MELGVPNRMSQQKLRPLDAILDADSTCWTKLREDKQSSQATRQTTKERRRALIKMSSPSTTQSRCRIPASPPGPRLRYVKLKARVACDEAYRRTDIGQ
jgi:hypothetical protein